MYMYSYWYISRSIKHMVMVWYIAKDICFPNTHMCLWWCRAEVCLSVTGSGRLPRNDSISESIVVFLSAPFDASSWHRRLNWSLVETTLLTSVLVKILTFTKCSITCGRLGLRLRSWCLYSVGRLGGPLAILFLLANNIPLRADCL